MPQTRLTSKPIWQSGDIVLIRSYTLRARLSSLASPRAMYFTHAGIAHISRDSQPQLIHAEPRTNNMWERNGVMIEPWENVAARGNVKTSAVVNPQAYSNEARERVIKAALTMHEQAIPFDTLMDARNPDKRYCTEFILVALEMAEVPLVKPYKTSRKIIYPDDLPSYY